MKVNVKVELYQDKIRRLVNAVTLSAEQAAEAVKSDINFHTKIGRAHV